MEKGEGRLGLEGWRDLLRDGGEGGADGAE